MPNNRWNEDAEKVFFCLFVYPDLLLNRISRFVVYTKLVPTSILFTVFFVSDEQDRH
jgi:hypothetical protein